MAKWRLQPVIVGKPVEAECIDLDGMPVIRLMQGDRFIGYVRRVEEIERAGIDLAQVTVKGGDAQ